MTTRIVAYTIVLLLLLSGLTTAMFLRSDVETTILRTSGLLFQEQPNQQISNLYNFKVVNKTFDTKHLQFKLENFEGQFKFIGDSNLIVSGQALKEGEFFLIINKKQIKSRSTKLKIGVYEDGKKIETVKTKFLGKHI